MRLALIHLADRFDRFVMRHRLYWLCRFISLSRWWGEDPCPCEYCRHAKGWGDR